MNRKKIAAIIVFGLTMTTCSSPAIGQVSTPIVKMKAPAGNYVASAEEQAKAQTNITVLYENTMLMNKTLKRLKSYVGKTWYAFSGNTPSGWDCSGLTMWFYEQFNIILEHRASKQQFVGSATTDPKPGDIVVFTYKGYKSAYHVGIYVGDGMMIHSPRPGYITTLENVETFGGKYSNISYRRVLETN